MTSPHDQTEQQAQAMHWEQVRLEPDPQETQELDQELPVEWTQEYRDHEAEFDQEVTDKYTHMDDKELNNELDIPKGDIDENAHQSLQELDIDTNELSKEIQLDRQEHTLDHDDHEHFGR
jgi:hypothetical protein